MTSLPPNHPQQPAGNLTNRYTALQAALTLANERFGEACNAGDVREARALKNSLENALREFREEVQRESDTLDDGRFLLKHEHEGLTAFAKNNKLKLEKVLARVTITDGSVTEADFKRMGLSTLEGLSALQGMIKLNVDGNRVASLIGVPTDRLKVLDASFCGLTGDLSAIANARELETLSVSVNSGLTSLHGVPTDKLKELRASFCGLAGDLSAIDNAKELAALRVSNNPGLTSLHGVPTHKLRILDAHSCGLTGDLSAIANATELETLYVYYNRGLTSLHGVPTHKLKVLEASNCGLTGDLSAIANATNLESLLVSGNPGLNQAEAEKTIEKLKQHSLRRVFI